MLNILYQFNDRYAPYAAVSMVSVFDNNPGCEIKVYVLGEYLSTDSIGKLKELCEDYGHTLVLIETGALVEKMKSWGLPTYRGSYAANMRLFLPEYPEITEDRVLYLDADTVIEGDLTSLMTVDMKGNVIAMVCDALGAMRKQDLGFDMSDSYFNSGVVLFDLKSWKAEDFSGKILDHVKNVRAAYPSPDQDLLNVVCHGRIMRLGAEYNFQPVHYVYKNKSYFHNYSAEGYYTESELDYAKENVKIYHCYRFVGEFPWHRKNVHPYSSLFDKYMDRTPWCGYEKKPADTGLVMKIEKIMYYIFPKGLFLSIFALSHRLFFMRANKQSKSNQINKMM